MAAKTYKPHISDHAVIRYLERIEGLDIEAVKDKMLTPQVRGALALGATKVEIGGTVFIAARGRLITTYEKNSR